MQKQFNRLAVVVALVGIVVASLGATARAANVTWNVAGGGDWDTTTANWTGDSTFYTEGDAVTFNNAAGGVINLTSNHAPLSTTVSAAAGTYTFSGSNITAGNLTKSGAGTLQMDNQYTFGGTISVTGGTLRLGASNRLADTANIGGGGTFDMNGFDETLRFASSGAVHITNMGNLTVNHNYLADRSGVGIMSGAGSLTFGAGHATTIIRDTHTYTGGTFINSGLVSMYSGASNQMPINGDMTIGAAGTFNLSWHNASGNVRTIDALMGSGQVTSGQADNSNNNTLRVGNANGSGAFSGVFSGGGSFVKLGTGTQTLSGNNTYLGTTVVSGGKLIINGNQGTLSAGQDNYTVQSGATLGGDGTINLAAAKAVSVLAGGILEPGDTVGTMTINGGLNLNDGAILNMDLNTGGDTIVVNGQVTGSASAGGITLNLNPQVDFGDFVLLDWTGGSASGLDLTDFNVVGGEGGTLSIVGSQLLFSIPAPPIPEPTSLALLSLGLLGLVRRGRRQKA